MEPPLRITQAALDTSVNSLLQWGIGGAILLIFVAPTFLLMVKGAQKREDERVARDAEERKAQSEREHKLIDALVASVEQQKAALEQWRAFEEREEKTHAALLSGMAQLTTSLASIADRVRSDEQASVQAAASQARLAELMAQIADRLARAA